MPYRKGYPRSHTLPPNLHQLHPLPRHPPLLPLAASRPPHSRRRPYPRHRRVSYHITLPSDVAPRITRARRTGTPARPQKPWAPPLCYSTPHASLRSTRPSSRSSPPPLYRSPSLLSTARSSSRQKPSCPATTTSPTPPPRSSTSTRPSPTSASRS